MVVLARNIEDLQAGDLVLARAQDDDADAAQLQAVVQVFRNSSDHLRIVRIADASGNVEVIQTTDEHPFWVVRTGWDERGTMVEFRGWVRAADLRGGDRLNEADDSNNAVVLSTVRQEHPERIAVYNFEVAGDHTYFVEDGQGRQTAVWVHNTCAGRNHFAPVGLGNAIPYGHESLRYLSEFRHTKLHRRLSEFLSTETTRLPNGRTVSMLPRRGFSGKQVQRYFSKSERENALDRFYKRYNRGEYHGAFVEELSVARQNGWW